jgi:hypothetical protein
MYFVSTHLVLSLLLSHYFSPCAVVVASIFNDEQQPGYFIWLKESWWFIQVFLCTLLIITTLMGEHLPLVSCKELFHNQHGSW